MQQRTQSTNNPPQIVVGPCVSLVDATRSMVLVIVLCLGWRLGMRPYLDFLADRRCREIEAELPSGGRHPFAIYQYRELFWWGFISDSPRYCETLYNTVRQLSPDDQEAIVRQRLWVAAEMDLKEHARLAGWLVVLAVDDEREEELRSVRVRAALRALIGWFRRFDAQVDSNWVHNPNARSVVIRPPIPLSTGLTLDPEQWYLRSIHYLRLLAAQRRLKHYEENESAHVERVSLLATIAGGLPSVVSNDDRLRADCLWCVRSSGLNRESQELLLQALLEGRRPESLPNW
ncbi:MAG: hypothetical protein SFV23_01610 [Planctomycetaceae bacterium]|nr:hypothetical protein [Planctomycetaceae bacterium]